MYRNILQTDFVWICRLSCFRRLFDEASPISHLDGSLKAGNYRRRWDWISASRTYRRSLETEPCWSGGNACRIYRLSLLSTLFEGTTLRRNVVETLMWHFLTGLLWWKMLLRLWCDTFWRDYFDEKCCWDSDVTLFDGITLRRNYEPIYCWTFFDGTTLREDCWNSDVLVSLDASSMGLLCRFFTRHFFDGTTLRERCLNSDVLISHKFLRELFCQLWELPWAWQIAAQIYLSHFLSEISSQISNFQHLFLCTFLRSHAVWQHALLSSHDQKSHVSSQVISMPFFTNTYLSNSSMYY